MMYSCMKFFKKTIGVICKYMDLFRLCQGMGFR